MSDPAERAKLLEIARAYMSLSRHVSDRHDYVTAHRGAGHDPRHRLNDS